MRISVENVSKSFGERIVLSNVCVELPARSVTALVGASGSGKSTLLGLIAGFQNPDEGQVWFIDNDKVAANSNLVAYMPQGSNALPHRTSIDNAAIGALAEGASLESALQMAKSALTTVGLSEVAGSFARQLSGGELQRLCFARALCSSRPVVLADEPSANLDSANVDKIVASLRELGREKTVVVATHDSDLLAAADVVLDLRALQRATDA